MPNDPRHSRFVAVDGQTGTLVIDTHIDQSETMQSPTQRQNGRKMITMRIKHHVDGETIATALCAYPQDVRGDTKADFEDWFRQQLKMDGLGHFLYMEFPDVDHPLEDEWALRRMSDWFTDFDIWKEYAYE